MTPRYPILTLLAPLALIPVDPLAHASNAQIIDDFSDVTEWTTHASEGVDATIEGDAAALRINIDFESGAGFCVVRRTLDLTLPDNFALSFDVRAEGLPPNNLELKLVAPETPRGEDVWWVNRRAFDFPAEWRTLTSGRRHFEFAWGPSGGGEPLKRLAAIEFAVASAKGGAGSVWIDNLRIETRPANKPYTATPRARASSDTRQWSGWRAVRERNPAPARGARSVWRIDWTSARDDESPWFEIDFQQPRVFGGIILTWSDAHPPASYRVQSSGDGRAWTDIAARGRSDGGRDAHFLPDAEASRLRIVIDEPVPPQGVGLRSFEVLSLKEGSDLNAFVTRLASDAPEGWFPEPFVGRQCFWTVVGIPEDDNEALISEHGAIEIAKGGPTLEPFLAIGDRLKTWADARTTQSTAPGGVPPPSVTWTLDDLTLEVVALADGDPDHSRVLAAYTVTNTGHDPVRGVFSLALRPFQVLPPWQRLNITGGVARIEELRTEDNTFFINGARGPRALTPPSRVFLAEFDDTDIVRTMGHVPMAPVVGGLPLLPVPARARTHTPPAQTVNDPLALASGVFHWDFELAPGEEMVAQVEIPLHPERALPDAADVRFGRRMRAAASRWDRHLDATLISLPPSASHITDTIRANLAYILINQDGPAIQPGSRTYERSWIRDGCMTSAALLALGLHENVRTYLDWYASYQFPSGKVPCVVDTRGPDPVDEHDSTGQLIHALRNYGAVTGDTDFLRAQFNRVVEGVEYIESLRARRLTPEYADPESPSHSRFGLVPESISHEGYSAKPMHSYWDDFFVLRGLDDAAGIARMLGEGDHAARFERLAAEFRTDLYASIDLAMRERKIDYIPGCVELGDFDATSTAVAIYPIGELANMPAEATRATFDRYWEQHLARVADTREWHDYTPYEARIIGALVVMGEPERAHELMDWLFLDQHPQAWRHWAEVAYRDDRNPGWIGDMPHTWVGAGFINSVLAMFAYPRRGDDSLVLAAGIKSEWISETAAGVAVRDLHTEHGALSYKIVMSADGGALTLDLTCSLTVPPGGIIFKVPGDRPIASATVVRQRVPINGGREIRIDKAPATVTVTFAE